MKTIYTLFFCCCFSMSYSQEDFTEENRFFYDVVPSVILDIPTSTKSVFGGGGGIQFKVGNNWYLRPNSRHKAMVRLSWIRLGIFGGDGSGLLFSPAHVGLGYRLNVNSNFSIDPMFSAGILLGTDDILNPGLEVDYAVYPEIKFNINHFVIGLEYTFKRYYSNFSKTPVGAYHYIGLTLGKKFGSNTSDR